MLVPQRRLPHIWSALMLGVCLGAAVLPDHAGLSCWSKPDSQGLQLLGRARTVVFAGHQPREGDPASGYSWSLYLSIMLRGGITAKDDTASQALKNRGCAGR